jgi:hypothetical protein
VGIYVVGIGYVLFARLVLRPWLVARMGGRPLPEASALLVFSAIVLSGVLASIVGQATASVVVGLLVFCVGLSAASTFYVLRSASRSPGSN